MKTLEELKNEVFTNAKSRPDYIRLGQYVFNYIDRTYGVARQVQFDDNVDCFYLDRNIDEFLECALKRINDKAMPIDNRPIEKIKEDAERLTFDKFVETGTYSVTEFVPDNTELYMTVKDVYKWLCGMYLFPKVYIRPYVTEPFIPTYSLCGELLWKENYPKLSDKVVKYAYRHRVSEGNEEPFEDSFYIVYEETYKDKVNKYLLKNLPMSPDDKVAFIEEMNNKIH